MPKVKVTKQTVKSPDPCVKCGESIWSDPKFASYPHERLLWKCSMCGFTVATPCLDTKDYDFESRCVSHGTWRCTACRDRAVRPSDDLLMMRAQGIAEKLNHNHSGPDVQFVFEQLKLVRMYARWTC